MADNTDEVVRVRDFIAKSVSEYWTATGKAMLLSALGLKVRTTFPSAPSLMPDGLSAFLSSWPTVRIVGHPEIPEKVGAIPLDAKIPDDVTELFSERRSVLIGTSRHRCETVRRPRYVTEFWRAFYSPIVDDVLLFRQPLKIQIFVSLSERTARMRWEATKYYRLT